MQDLDEFTVTDEALLDQEALRAASDREHRNEHVG